MMKFVIIQCVKAYKDELKQIFRSIQVDAYSEMDVEGFMKNADGTSDYSNWFGSTKNPYDYMVSFSFLAADKAEELLKRVDDFNNTIQGMSPMNAHIVGVEKSV